MNFIINILIDYYLWIKAMHIVSAISWLAGIFYLPRLYVYHVEGFLKKGVENGSEMDLLFQHQERLLLKAIMTPAMISTWFFGICLVFTPGIINWEMAWPWVKGVSIVFMTIFHFYLSKKRQDFIRHNNTLMGKSFRILNEVPTILMLLIVFSVVLKF